MKHLIVAVLGVFTLCSTAAYTQSRDIGAQRLILDNGGTGRLTIQYTGTTASTLTIPSGGGSLNPAGTTTGSTLFWNGSSWAENPALRTDATGNLAVDGLLAMPMTTATTGQITLDGVPFMHAQNYGTFLGRFAGNLSLSGFGTVGIGYRALTSLTTGASNTAVGDNAMSNTTTGNANTGIGSYSLYANTTGINNTAVGLGAIQSSTTASSNTAVGNAALEMVVTGDGNTAIGASALSAAEGSENTAVGFAAAMQATANGNTAIGFSGLMNLTTGTNNTAIGRSTSVSDGTVSNVTLLGAGAATGTSNTVVLGNGSVTQVTTAGNINAPSATLSNLRVAAGTDKYAGTVLTDDASADGIEFIFNTMVSSSSIVVVTLNTPLGGTSVVNATPGPGTLEVYFSGNVPNGSKLSYVIVNP